MDKGFAVIAIAGRREEHGDVEILDQQLYLSNHADREMNMRQFADFAAEACLRAMSTIDSSSTISCSGIQKEKGSDNTTTVEMMDDNLYLDRSSHIRSDDAIMQDLYQRKDALHVIMRGTDEVLFASSTDLELPTLQNLLEGKPRNILKNEHQVQLEKRTFIGRLGTTQTPVFASVLPSNMDVANKEDCYFENTRSHAPLLNPVHNELALTATAYANWQKTHQFCCTCGAPFSFIQGGTCAKCMGSERSHIHFPRQDPSIIVLVTNPTRTHAVLARSPRHPPYLYTCLAGFVEAGETFERAVTREVHEEVGIHVDAETIRYIASQPWPFPRSTMIGMHANTLEDMAPITIDPHEIVDALWFEKEVVYQATRQADEIGPVLDRQLVDELEWDGKLLVPPQGVLARKLVDHWLEE